FAAHPLARFAKGGLGRTLATLVKAALLDMQAALNAYAEAEAASRMEVIAKLGRALSAMAEGDMRADISGLPTAYNQITAD
ncbi:hypothetical protein ACSTLE_23560, partial [Vibrio parahaemolyticus]